MLYTSGPLPDNVYAPLEAASSSFADPKLAGKFRGGVGNIQIVRYSDTPAGKSMLDLLDEDARILMKTADCKAITTSS